MERVVNLIIVGSNQMFDTLKKWEKELNILIV